MTQPEKLSEKAIDIYQLKEELKAIEARDGELSFRSQKTKEYIDSISQMDIAKAKEVREKIENLNIPRFKDEYISKIIDVKPLTTDDLKQLISTFGVGIKEDFLKEIIKILN